MPVNLSLLDLGGIVRSWGRGVAFYAERWDPGLGTPLVLTHLGDTEGDISINLNGETKGFTTPELTGPAIHEADFTGENPVIELPLYLADPDLLKTVSPGNSAHGGRSMVGPVTEFMLVLFPEQLFVELDNDDIPHRYQLVCTAGAWTLNGQAITAAKQTLLDVSHWFWRGYFNRAGRKFRGGAGEDRKAIETVSFQVMHHPDMPEGHHLFTVGDPFDSDIDLDGGS